MRDRTAAFVLVALVLPVALATLLPLAYATPPDPTWIAGLWDDGDHDDIIFLITDIGAAELSVPTHGRAIDLAKNAATRLDAPAACRGPGSSPLTRAPPAS